MHKDFFQDSSPTDCISFPYDDSAEEDDQSYCFLGEVFVCPATAIEYVEKKGINVYEEVMLYIVHGLLHLLGFDDLEKSDRRKMRYQEKRAMEYLKGRNLMIQAK